MRSLIFAVAALLTALPYSGSFAQSLSPPPPQSPPQPQGQAQSQSEVDQAEVLRMGDLVQATGGEAIRSVATDAFVEAMRPPQDDSSKWFISVVTIPGCSGCEQLKRDWGSSPWLLALANPSDPSKSWSHFKFYDRNDRSQAFRWEKVRISSYPTILVQPPRSGSYGNPATVVYQGVYQGNPEQQARGITAAIRQYISTLPNVGALAGDRQPDLSGGIRQGQFAPPWNSGPQATPWNPDRAPVLPNFDPLIPPLPDFVKPNFGVSWGTVLSILGATFLAPVALALGTVAASTIRQYSPATKQQQPPDPTAVNQLVDDLVERLTPPPTGRATTRKTTAGRRG